MQKNSPNLIALFSVTMLSGFVLASSAYAGEHDVNHTRPKPNRPGAGTKPGGVVATPANAVLVNNENIDEVRSGPQPIESANKEKRKSKGDWHATEVAGGYMATTGKPGDPIDLSNTDGKIYMSEQEAQHASNQYNRFERKGDKFMDTGEVTPGGPLK